MSADNSTTNTDIDRHLDNPAVDFDDIDCLSDTKEKLRNTVISTVVEGFESYGTHAALLYGPAGTGKTQLATAVAGELWAHDFQFYRVNTLENDVGSYGDYLESVLQAARDDEPAVVLLDCFIEVAHDSEARRIFRNLMDDISAAGDQVVALCTLDGTKREFSHMQEELAYPSCKVEVTLPAADRRQRILESELQAASSSGSVTFEESDIDFEDLAAQTDDFTVSELVTVTKRAVQRQRSETDGDLPVTLTQAQLASVVDTIAAESISDPTHPHAQDDNDDVPYAVESVPDVSFDDIGGLDEAKREVRECVQFAANYGSLFEPTNFSPKSGVLLYGPPGNGKTMLAKALANATDRTFLSVEGAEMKSKWYGQSVENLRTIFETAREHAPSVIFFDEFDAIGKKRGEISDGTPEAEADIVNTLLNELNGLKPSDDGVLVLAATNRPSAIDPALLRPGRLEAHVEVGIPDEEGRAAIFDVHMEGVPTSDDVTGDWFVAAGPDPMTGADVMGICKEAFHLALREAPPDAEPEDILVTRDILERAMTKVETISRESATEGTDDFAGFQ